MTDFHKYFLTNILQGLEEKQEKEDATEEPIDIMALGKQVRAAKTAGIDAIAFLERCHDRGLTIPQSLAALDVAIARDPLTPAATPDPPKT